MRLDTAAAESPAAILLVLAIMAVGMYGVSGWLNYTPKDGPQAFQPIGNNTLLCCGGPRGLTPPK
jgi:hypothetical protein